MSFIQNTSPLQESRGRGITMFFCV